ncbi:hypothetical protein HDU97_000759 [Phlyctochytrium planicorne]|nr:hypothetical protein HDU97_000759 [Phlyctochytrium planicorne]
MHLNTILLTVAAAVACSVNAQTFCNNGLVPGSLCLHNCEGNGLYVRAPPLVTSISLPSFQLDFDPNNGFRPLASASGVKVGISIPSTLSTVRLAFTNAGSSISIGIPGANLVANIVTNDGDQASGDSDSKVINLGFNRAPLAINDENGFKEFLKSVTLASGDVQVRMAGFANTKAVASSATSDFAGISNNVCLRYVGFDTTSTLKGFGGLQSTSINGPPKILGGQRDRGIQLDINLVLNNPSNVVLNANADASFDLFYNNANCGTVILPNVQVQPGRNDLKATSYAKGDGSTCREMLTKFTGGQDINVLVRNGRVPQVPSLEYAFGALALPPQRLESNKQPLIAGAFIGGIKIGIPITASSAITATNPFDSPVTITHITANIKRDGDVIGVIDTDVSGFILPTKGSARSPPLRTVLKLNLEAVGTLFDLLKKSANGTPITVESSLTVTFGDYSTSIDYRQDTNVKLDGNLLAWPF